MREFVVTVTRDTTESASITVQADSDAMAEELALKQSHNDETEWEQDDTANLSKDHYVTNVNESHPEEDDAEPMSLGLFLDMVMPSLTH